VTASCPGFPRPAAAWGPLARGPASITAFCHYLQAVNVFIHGTPGNTNAERDTTMDTDTKHYPVTHTDAEWRKLLTPEQYRVMRGHGTEAPGSCALNYEKRAGTFFCVGCQQPLFASKRKFESGTGWPSFNDPEPGAVESSTDNSYGMMRTEVHCSRCGSHLGHVFEDGPPPTHLRYCINGVAMDFKPE
jgi:peptide-methionine (R)-S-oxide reductase